MKYYRAAFLPILFVLIGCQTSDNFKSSQDFSIDYEKFTLSNGLDVILHEDHSDPIVAVATLMHVGSNREKTGRTGFAHFFEHMSFNDSENVPRGANRKLIPEWGGQRNGGTWSDGTIYYEVVPKDAFEKILWIDSDRFGYMINTVTKAALEREKQVVKNEKRQRVDNAPYGFTDEIIRKNLYPTGHPYSWTVIGELPDLQAATLEDVKEFYAQYYGAANATLAIAGDIDIEETKELVEQWFGEIRKGPDVEPLNPMPVTLEESKSVYFLDNFATLPEIRIVFPTVEQMHKDVYALDILGSLLSNSKKAPLYKVIVEEKKLAPNVSTYQNSNELAGEFIIRVRANAGVDLDSVKAAIDESLALFETKGFDDNELIRIKAEMETQLYMGFETVLNKAFSLVNDNEYAGDPGYIVKSVEYTNAVTRKDVMRVYDRYIKDKKYVMTSVVPKDQPGLIVDGAEIAEVYEEEIVPGVEHEEVSQGEEADYEKTPTRFDRSEPAFGELPMFTMPEIWTAELDKTGIMVTGIESSEIPVVSFEIRLEGGHMLDPMEKAGLASLTADLMMEGTANRTPAELEEAIGLLGASVSLNGSDEEISLTASCLAKNYEATIDLVEEIMLEPRWDETEYERLKQALETRLKGNEASPSYIASSNFRKLMYGEDHILGISSSGSPESVGNITLDDLKAFYTNNFSASLASINVVGYIDRDRVINSLAELDDRWEAKAVERTSYEIPDNPGKGKLYFIDVPGAKQSFIAVGKLTLSGSDPDFDNLEYANEILGGGSSGELMQILRIEKGYTYGAYSFLQKHREISPFLAYTSVRTNATRPSLEIIADLLENYGSNFSEEDVETTRNKILKSNTRAYESMNAKLGILREVSKYDRSLKYIEEEQEKLMNLTLGDYKSVIDKYLPEDQMTYLVVGDRSTQRRELNSLGKGKAVELDIYGNILE